MFGHIEHPIESGKIGQEYERIYVKEGFEVTID